MNTVEPEAAAEKLTRLKNHPNDFAEPKVTMAR